MSLNRYTAYLWPCYSIWVLDRLLRLFRTLYIRYLSIDGTATISLISADTVSVRLRLSRGLFLHWRPGQSAYLTIPSISKYALEAHPFTIASVDESSTFDGESGSAELEMLFIVQARDGFTSRLLHQTIATGGKMSVSTYINGPYGSPPDMFAYEKTILVAGEHTPFREVKHTHSRGNCRWLGSIFHITYSIGHQ